MTSYPCDEPGTNDWWGLPPFCVQGPADAILRLLEQGEISRAKARELLEALVKELPRKAPVAPWDKLNWCDEEREG